ncbi:hypothetical protein [Flavobacterium sp.]|uniref:hypothetical protein n=1 Tax=Flavobacterium sp. TaxID=239 RepID=UPI00286D9FF6|nr:hypothetical protein [Flavobacterium sp.]
MNEELKKLFEIKEIDSKDKIYKIDYPKHWLIRLGIPVVIFFLIWQASVGANLDILFLKLSASSIVLFVTSLLLIIETISLRQTKVTELRNINYFLLTIYIFGFIIFTFFSIALANF